MLIDAEHYEYFIKYFIYEKNSKEKTGSSSFSNVTYVTTFLW